MSPTLLVSLSSSSFCFSATKSALVVIIAPNSPFLVASMGKHSLKRLPAKITSPRRLEEVQVDHGKTGVK